MYKFKSTPVGSKPTNDDLHKIVFDGIPGTAMPSFKLLPADELDALVHYVRYLSLRGETERQLLTLLADADEGALLVDPEDPAATQADVIDAVTMVAEKWASANEQATPIPPRSTMSDAELVESRKRGRELFYGTVANCVKCHGDSALGDGQTSDYDEWAKEFMTPNEPDSVKPFVAVGLLPPRNIRPRNLRLGMYRGGNRPIDLYWRVRLGIEGTPMPAATMKPEDDPNAKGLTSDDIWDIDNYVQSLPYEPINNPYDHLPAYTRERM
jgi:mono/diheme cytochrome c family protein